MHRALVIVMSSCGCIYVGSIHILCLQLQTSLQHCTIHQEVLSICLHRTQPLGAYLLNQQISSTAAAQSCIYAVHCVRSLLLGRQGMQPPEPSSALHSMLTPTHRKHVRMRMPLMHWIQPKVTAADHDNLNMQVICTAQPCAALCSLACP